MDITNASYLGLSQCSENEMTLLRQQLEEKTRELADLQEKVAHLKEENSELHVRINKHILNLGLHGDIILTILHKQPL